MRGFIFCLSVLWLSACAPAAPDGVDGRGSETANWWDKLPRAEWAEYERVAPSTPWFEIYNIRPNVFAIYEPGHFEEVISFLIVGDNQALLFDTGLGMGDIKAVVEKLTDKPVILLNSHGHFDHIGGNHQFNIILGVDNAYAQARTKGLPHADVAEFVSDGWLRPDNLAPGFSAAHYAIKPYKFDGYVTDGQIIDLGGRELGVIFTPGHSPDSLSLLDRNNRQLFIGDTFYLAPLYAHLEGSNVADYQESAERLAALTPAVTDVMTSHNVPIVKASYLLDMKKAFAAIKDGQTPYSLSDGAREYRFDGFSILTPDTD